MEEIITASLSGSVILKRKKRTDTQYDNTARFDGQELYGDILENK